MVFYFPIWFPSSTAADTTWCRAVWLDLDASRITSRVRLHVSPPWSSNCSNLKAICSNWMRIWTWSRHQRVTTPPLHLQRVIVDPPSPTHLSLMYLISSVSCRFSFAEYKQRFPTFNSPLLERMRKRRAFADPELNYAMDTTLLGSSTGIVTAAAAAAAPASVIGNAFYDLLGNAAAVAATAAAAAVAQKQQQQPHGYQSMPHFTHTPTITNTSSTNSTAKKPKLSFSIESIIGINT